MIMKPLRGEPLLNRVSGSVPREWTIMCLLQQYLAALAAQLLYIVIHRPLIFQRRLTPDLIILQKSTGFCQEDFQAIACQEIGPISNLNLQYGSIFKTTLGDGMGKWVTRILVVAAHQHTLLTVPHHLAPDHCQLSRVTQVAAGSVARQADKQNTRYFGYAKKWR